MNQRMLVLLTAAATLVLGACDRPAPGANEAASDSAAINTAASNDPVANALSAAPASVSKDASVIAPQPDGSMKTLREGTNGWTCIPDNPDSPVNDPMCMDANAMKWAAAWMSRQTPPPNNVGLGYMIQGAADPSNTDPFAKKPAEGDDWIRTGPHLMVFGADSLLENYQSGPNPDTTVPYVMWAGTPYAHLMIPTGD